MGYLPCLLIFAAIFPTAVLPGAALRSSRFLDLWNLRIRIAQLGLIRGARPGVQFFQQFVIPVVGFQFRYPAVGIVNVAEDDGLRRTRLLASGDDFAVANRTILLFRLDFYRVDALHAVGAFFHHAAAAHADVGIAHAKQAGRLPIRVQQEIEAAHFIRTVVGAVARAHAAVVDHFVQAFRAVDRRGHRADHFAGGILAVHAEDRFVVRPRIVYAAFIVTVDADPVHVAADHDFFFANHGDIIFRLASHHTAAAAGAGVQVDGHAPGVAFVFHRGIQRQRILFGAGLGELRIFAVVVQRRDANRFAILHSALRLH